MLNPITYTETVVGDFLRYQLTTYPSPIVAFTTRCDASSTSRRPERRRF